MWWCRGVDDSGDEFDRYIDGDSPTGPGDRGGVDYEDELERNQQMQMQIKRQMQQAGRQQGWGEEGGGGGGGGSGSGEPNDAMQRYINSNSNY